MLLREIENSRVIILEGVSGVGKTSYRNYLQSVFETLGKRAFIFTEEELLFSWKHVAINGIEHLRFDLYERLLAEIQREFLSQDDITVIIERFHISAKVVSWFWDKALDERCENISRTLARIPAHICLMTLSKEQFLARHGHASRGAQWQHYLERKKNRFGVSNLDVRIQEEQRLFLDLVNKSSIPHSVVPAYSFPLA